MSDSPVSALFDQVMESIADLPEELRDHLLMVKETDAHFESARRLIQKRRSVLLKQGGCPDEEPSSQQRRLEKDCKRAAGYIDEKLAYMQRIYEIVKRHRNSLSTFNEAALCDAFWDLAGDLPAEERAPHWRSRRNASVACQRAEPAGCAPEGLRPEAAQSACRRGEGAASITDQLVVGSTAELQEQVYCYCRQVAFGDMIGCDNPNCKVEWFHYACVGLSSPPSKWYCPDCRSSVGSG